MSVLRMGNHEQVKTFKQLGLCEHLLQKCEEMGYYYPSKIQSGSLQCTGRDLIRIAPSKAGKTVAFVLLILQALSESQQPLFSCVLSRSREHVVQICQLFEDLKPSKEIQTEMLVVGTNINQQALLVAGAPSILVGTPDRVCDLLRLTPINRLPNLKYLVLDEADDLLVAECTSKKNDCPVDNILQFLPEDCIKLLFASTMCQEIVEFGKKHLTTPDKIIVACEHHYRCVRAQFKDCYVVDILSKSPVRTCMIFTRTQASASVLSLLLSKLGFKSISMKKTEMPELQDRLWDGVYTVLVGTSDCVVPPCVDTVINYDTPFDFQDYIKRASKTALAWRSAHVISLVDDDDITRFREIESKIGCIVPEYPSVEKDVLTLFEKVTAVRKKSLKKIGGITKRKKCSSDDDEEKERKKKKNSRNLLDIT